jgi:hypothetical protein
MSDIDSFLTGDDPGQAEAEQPSEPQAPEATPAEAETEDKPVPAKEEADDSQPEDVVGLKSALQAERARRRDYKGERDRLQGERDALMAQMEVYRKAPPAPPAPPSVPQAVAPPERVPNPVEDPEGYAAWQEQRFEKRLFNERLNISERMLRARTDSADVDAKIAVFRKAAADNPGLRAQLGSHPDPYQFAYDTGARFLAMEEIGTDPAAYRAKVETELRAKIEAELAGTQPSAPAPRVTLPQSLGTARSAGPRSGPPINVAESFDDILARPRK